MQTTFVKGDTPYVKEWDHREDQIPTFQEKWAEAMASIEVKLFSMCNARGIFVHTFINGSLTYHKDHEIKDSHLKYNECSWLSVVEDPTLQQQISKALDGASFECLVEQVIKLGEKKILDRLETTFNILSEY